MGANIISGGTDKQYYIINYLNGIERLGTGYHNILYDFLVIWI